jgi:hypothetical protein
LYLFRIFENAFETQGSFSVPTPKMAVVPISRWYPDFRLKKKLRGFGPLANYADIDIRLDIEENYEYSHQFRQ